jgi:hypothetical protein
LFEGSNAAVANARNTSIGFIKKNTLTKFTRRTVLLVGVQNLPLLRYSSKVAPYHSHRKLQ